MANIDRIMDLIKENKNEHNYITLDKLQALAITTGCYSSKYHFKSNLQSLTEVGFIKGDFKGIEWIGVR